MAESWVEDDRNAYYRHLFDWLADRYLEQTHRVSWGRYPGWIDRMVEVAAERQPERLVDIGCGPGYFLSRVHAACPHTELTAVDLSPRMLDQVSVPASRHAEALERFAPGHPHAYDAAVMSFVLRDVDDRPAALRAVHQVLAPGGRFILLETHRPEGVAAWGFDGYVHGLLPNWGDRGLTRDWAGDRDRAPYRWLSRTQRTWDRGKEVPDWLTDAGFTHLHCRTRPDDVVMLWSAEASPTA